VFGISVEFEEFGGNPCNSQTGELLYFKSRKLDSSYNRG
jgi:hypothetical protein